MVLTKNKHKTEDLEQNRIENIKKLKESLIITSNKSRKLGHTLCNFSCFEHSK